jgi:hypothetical protein
MRAIVWVVLLVSVPAWATTPTVRQIDQINANGGSVLSVPSVGTKFLSDTNTVTVTGKTISGGSNTLSQLPVATQTIQVVVTPSPNGSNTSFTLSTTPGAGVGVSLYLDGLVLAQGSGLDYTISGSTITMAVAPSSGQRLIAIYSQY